MESAKIAENETVALPIEQKYPLEWEHIATRFEKDPNISQKPLYDCVKRIFDIVCSCIALIFFSWLFLLVAIAIKIEDGGPVFYSQTRVGKNGKFFVMHKFRSMYVDADRMKAQLLEQNEMNGPTFKMEHDPRVTRVGRFIRRTSIDELPQLVNILEGSMSVVGPRPPLGAEVMQYDDYAMRRLSVKPGLTCYWQISGRNDVSFDEWIEMDLEYIRNAGVATDIAILFKTARAVLTGRGAY